MLLGNVLEEGSSATDCVTDVTDRSPMEVGSSATDKRKKEEGKCTHSKSFSNQKSPNCLGGGYIAILNHSCRYVGAVPPCPPSEELGNHGGIAPTNLLKSFRIAIGKTAL